jgi:hypothetical protein
MTRTVVSPEAVNAALAIREAGGTLGMEERPSFGHLTEEPDRKAATPLDGMFPDEGFLPAPEIESIARELIDAYPELGHIAQADVGFVWKRKGGRTRGRDVYGKCQPASGLLAHFSRCDFVVWIAADHVRESGFTRLQLEALVYHELKHIGFEIDDDEKSPTYGEMKLVGRGHDDEIFIDEVLRYGAWNHSRRRAGEAYQQVTLPEAS